MLPTPNCLSRRAEWFAAGTAPTQPDSWTARVGDGVVFRLPELAREWAQAQGWTLSDATGANVASIRLTRPFDGAQYRLASELPRDAQRLTLEMAIAGLAVRRAEFDVDGESILALPSAPYSGLWMLRPGSHTVVGRVWLADGRMIETPPARIIVLP